MREKTVANTNDSRFSNPIFLTTIQALLLIFIGTGFAVAAKNDSSAGGKIGSSRIKANAITSKHIANGTVTGADVHDSTIASRDILDGALTGEDLRAYTVTSNNIAPDAITTSHIVNSTIKQEDLDSGSIGASQIIDGSITSSEVATSAIGSQQIADGAIDRQHLSPTPFLSMWATEVGAVSSTTDTVHWDAEESDAWNMHEPNDDLITIPADGIWAIDASMMMQNASDSDPASAGFRLRLVPGGSGSPINLAATQEQFLGSGFRTHDMNETVVLSEGDQISIVSWVGSGVVGGSDDRSTRITATWLAPTPPTTPK